jgi:phosphatidate phosphatase APP1
VTLPPGHPLLLLIDSIDRVWDAAIAAYHARFGYKQPIVAVPFHGFGTHEKIWLEGRVLADRGIHTGAPDRGPWMNFVDMMKRYASYEVPDAKIVVRFRGREYRATTDREGFYHLELEVGGPLEEQLWQPLEVEIEAPLGRTQERFVSPAWAQVPPREATIGVISDLDDTVVRTGATHLLRHVTTVLMGSAHSRQVFPGVAELYVALQKGKNPIWYLSSSPWNIYDLIVEMMDLRGVPRGTLLMKDFGFDRDKFFKIPHRVHKLGWISRIVETYPTLSFVLIGDTGQADAEIYRAAVEAHPGRIKAVYLREIRSKRHEAAKAHVSAIRSLGVEAVIAETSLAAAQSAQRLGLITDEELSQVGEATRRETS